MPQEKSPDWLDLTVESARHPVREVHHFNRYFEQHVFHGYDPDGSHGVGMVYVPSGTHVPGEIDFGPAPGWLTSHHGDLFCKWAEAAPLLRKAIIDESVPLKMEMLKGVGWNFDGGRLGDAMILGEIKYHPALPELCEAMAHDIDAGMRYSASSAIGSMGAKARKHVPLLCRRLFMDKALSVRTGIAGTLGSIGDKRASVPLRDAAEEARMMMHAYPMLGDYETHKEAHDWLWNYEQALRALVHVDKNSGREAVEAGMRDENVHVSFWANRIGEVCGVFGEFDEPLVAL